MPLSGWIFIKLIGNIFLTLLRGTTCWTALMPSYSPLRWNSTDLVYPWRYVRKRNYLSGFFPQFSQKFWDLWTRLPQWIQNGSTGDRAALVGVIRGWTGITGFGAFHGNTSGLLCGGCGEFCDEAGAGVVVGWPTAPGVSESHCIVFASCWPIRYQEIPIMAIRSPTE